MIEKPLGCKGVRRVYKIKTTPNLPLLKYTTNNIFECIIGEIFICCNKDLADQNLKEPRTSAMVSYNNFINKTGILLKNSW